MSAVVARGNGRRAVTEKAGDGGLEGDGMSDLIQRLERACGGEFQDDYSAQDYLNLCHESRDELERINAELEEANARGDGFSDGYGRQRERAERAEALLKKADEANDSITKVKAACMAERDALRKELDRLAAAPQQTAEPVAWAVYWKDGQGLVSNGLSYVCHSEPHPIHMDQVKVPLYASPPRITTAQIEQLKRLADEMANCYFSDDSGEDYAQARAALHAALDALHTKGTP